MAETNEWLRQRLAGLPEHFNALSYALQHQLVDLDPWQLFVSDEDMRTRSNAVNGRYKQRTVLCFAQRRDNDDVACLVLNVNEHEKPGDVLIVHDFAKTGSEVDEVFDDFWGWFRMAVEDMIDTFRHLGDHYEP